MAYLGNKVRDTISGLEGVVIERVEWLYGCIRVGVQPATLHEGRIIDADFLDDSRVEVIDKFIEKLPESNPIIKLGSAIKDRVTGLTGIAGGRIERLWGGTEIMIEPREHKDGQPAKGTFMPEGRLELTEEHAVARPAGTPPGGPRDDDPPGRRGYR